MKIKENAQPIYSSDPLYDLFNGGYIKPHDFLETKDAVDVEIAILKVKIFFQTLEVNGLIEYE